MRQGYEVFFRERLARMEGPDADPDWREVRELLPSDWRSDATYFLLQTIMSMVIEPYVSVSGRGPAEQLSDLPLWDDLVADVRQIVIQSRETARLRERRYVSATSVTMALGLLAPSLRLTDWQIWGPSE